MLFRRALTEKGLKLEVDVPLVLRVDHSTLPTRPNGEGIETSIVVHTAPTGRPLRTLPTRPNGEGIETDRHFCVSFAGARLFRRALTEKGLKPGASTWAPDSNSLSSDAP